MATGTMTPVINHLRRVALLPDGADLGDGQLLESFIRRKDEAAFESLVRRHGPMVLGVCRRILGNPHDAEDAFQAAFLVLARKAQSIVPASQVGNWLHGVAYRTAMKARSRLTRLRAREKQMDQLPEPVCRVPEVSWHDLQPILDRELSGLPVKYRLPVVLCDLEGKTGKEVARQLAWPEGTVSSRLARGRSLLARRLTRHGPALTAGSLALLISRNAATACLPAGLASCTARAALAFAVGSLAAPAVSADVVAVTEGVLKAMILNRVKLTAVVLLALGVAGTGLGGASYWASAGDQPADSPNGPPRSGAVSSQVAVRSQSTAEKNQGETQDKDRRHAYEEAFLKGLHVSSELSRWLTQGQNKPEKNLSPAPSEGDVKELFEWLRKSYRPGSPQQGEIAARSKREASEQAFLKAFRISSELAKAGIESKSSGSRTAEASRLSFTFSTAYEEARRLRNALAEMRGQSRSQTEKTLEALDQFLNAGKELERAVQQDAKTQAIAHARKELSKALSGVEQTTHDQRKELETLDAIERIVQEMKARILAQERRK